MFGKLIIGLYLKCKPLDMDGYKLVTPLANYRYGHNRNPPPVKVIWWKLNYDNMPALFTYKEMEEFERFTLTMSNFAGSKNYHPASSDELPDNSDYGIMDTVNAVKFLVIRPKPNLITVSVMNQMDIILMDGTRDNHTFNLPFDVIGEIKL